MNTLIMLWTTFVCVGGEIRPNVFFGPNMYSSDLYHSIETADKEIIDWQTRNNRGDCIVFMVQKEDVTNKKILQKILGIY